MKTFDQFTEDVNAVLAFIKKAHAGQSYGSKPYWTHPKAVAVMGKKLFGSKFTDDAYTAALLHDVVEDTPYSLKDLANAGFSDKVLKAVGLLTKDNAITYEANIARIISSGDKIAMMVKFADNYMNYSGDKSSWSETKRLKSQAKYRNSMVNLSKHLNVNLTIPEHNSLDIRYSKSLSMLGEALEITINICD